MFDALFHEWGLIRVELSSAILHGPFSDACQGSISRKIVIEMPKNVARRKSSPGPPVSHKVVGAVDGLFLASKNQKKICASASRSK